MVYDGDESVERIFKISAVDGNDKSRVLNSHKEQDASMMDGEEEDLLQQIGRKTGA